MTESTKEELRAELGAASVELRQMQSRAEAAEQRHRLSDRLRHEAEAECATLRAELELLRDHSVTVDADCQHAHSERRAAESRLAAATELLGRIIKYSLEDGAVTPGFTRLLRVLAEAEAFLAAQPASPCPHCTSPDGHCPWHRTRLCSATEGENGRGEHCRLRQRHDGVCRFYDDATQPAAPAIRDLGTLDIDDGLDEPTAPSLGHPGTDEVFGRLQARRAEQRVLDAMSNINTAVLQEHIQTSQGPAMAAFKAELARREVTSGDQ
jgi:hypothetical protein